MNSKVRKISYKIYLTAQGIVVAIGTGVLIWNLVAGAHDLYISSKGRECVDQVIGADTIESFAKNDALRWTDAIEEYAQSFDHPAKVYALKELLERKCSDYIRVSIYDYSQKLEMGVYTNNYMDGYPAKFSERAGYVGLTVGITLLFVGLLFGLMKWLTWLLKD